MSLIVTILTGRRPHLLQRTLETTMTRAWFSHASRMVAFVNGNDLATQKVVDDWIYRSDYSTKYLTIGEATSACARIALSPSYDYWLHLEDDWECINSEVRWLEESIALLGSGKVDQIRLRDASEKVLTKHMVTGAPIRWKKEGNFDIGEAHLTFNPFLMRVSDIGDAFPCEGERDAQRKWLAAGHKMVAQHHPGLFRHIGGGESLRGKQS